MTQEKRIYIFQTICYALFIPLHLLNTFSIGPIKLFYIPVFIMGMFGLFDISHLYKRNKVIRWIIWLLLFSVMPILVSGLSSLFGYLTFVLLVISQFPLINLNKKLFLKLSPSFLFLSLIIVKKYATYDLSDMRMRFLGLYNDPNYLVMSIIISVFICICAFRHSTLLNKLIILGVFLLSLNFLLLSQSRGGLFSMTLMLALGLCELFFTNKKLAIFILVLFFAVSGKYIASNAERIAQFYSRIEGMNKEKSANMRLWQAQAAWRGAMEHPELVAFGVGVGKTGEVAIAPHQRPDNTLELVYQNQKHVIHITPVAIWFEHGLLAFVCYIAFNGILLFRLLKQRQLFVLGLYLAMTLQSCTINTVGYLPYWMTIFLCINIYTILPWNNTHPPIKLSLSNKYENR